jgi:diguanylate cyclase (GGDEF)-like protein
VFANKKFYSFFGYRDLTEFNASQSNISEFFIEKEHFFHPGKITEGTDWVEQISTLIDSKRVVSMRDINHQMHAFSVTVTDYGDQGNIVSFTDISETMSEHLALEEKTIHDQLTGAYNREYLEQKQARLISSFSQSRQHMGLALIDIDHFKAVNDSHGHDIGDKVLKQFVQIIQQNSRADDIVIRWGGEEFVLILRVNSEENLKCVLENLRKTVASVTFSKAGHQTCSIGGTIHRHDEPINETIKRADEALYQAKNSGRNNVVLAK